MQSKYTTKWEDFKYSNTRRGLMCVSPIKRDDKVIATLHDAPEKIVAAVDFINDEERKLFLEEAKVLLRERIVPDMEDSMLISEYARQLSMDEEKAAFPRMKKK